MTPSLPSRMIAAMGFAPDTRCVPLFGYGCAGGAIGLGVAADLFRASPAKPVLLVSLELCSIAYDHSRMDKKDMVALALFADVGRFDAWAERWLERAGSTGTDPAATAAAMDRVNPIYIARNHLVEDALAAATAGDLAPFDRLLDVVSQPFDERPGLEAYAATAPANFGPYRTFCGT